ncbi:MAG: ATP-dependent DNA helicase RecG [Clostridiales bacterium]|nr:ATP-dependent DNA helicase RecG [Clostridiales bacterium]
MMALSELKGLGKARLEALDKAGIKTLTDLLLTLPARYQDTTTLTPLGEIAPGGEVCVSGYPKAAPRLSRFKGMTSVTVRLCDETGSIPVVWFNQPWLQQQIKPEEPLTLYGRIDRDKQGRIRMASPIRVQERGITPVYKAVGGIPPKVMRDLMRQALTQLEDCCQETLPDILRIKYGLCERNFALRQAHFPETKENLFIALRRITFENMLLYQTAAAALRGERSKGIVISAGETACEAYWQTLPFPPTGAQKRVLQEIAGDLSAPHAMGRLVQGDVGCGKTALAFGAMYMAAQAGFQSVLMAPTEILARQHLESAKKMLEPLGIPCGLLLGGMKAKERREALQKIASGEWQAVIGTHALISEGVEYENLGLVITDEQHRFGVRQRRLLSKKADSDAAPNELVLSATPIPRSLALVLYGDLDLSIVDELPPGRTPVKTRIVPEEKRQGLYDFIRSEAKKGQQTYIVCPLVEESEAIDARSAQETYAELAMGPLSDLRLGMTYGDQEAAEKDETIRKFASGELDVLVSTTVIEVGVNVPAATVMVIENADRFGLSQLHQLRGRVGRGAKESWCFLMAAPNERLKTLCETNDGFVIAKKDLELRGPGDFLGTRQHGDTMIPGMAMGADVQMLEESSSCLKWLRSPGYEAEWAQVKESARAAFARVMEEIAMN